DFVYRITIGEIPFITSIAPLGGPAGAATTVELKGWNLPTTKVTLDNKDRAPGLYPIFVRKDQWISNYVPFNVEDLPEIKEKKSNSQHRTAEAVKLPVIINGVIEKPEDRDYFKFEGVTGQQIVAEVMAHRLNSPLDSILKITDAEGKQLAFNDDFEDKAAGLETHHADSYLRYTLPTNGTFYIEITDTAHRGGPEYAYRLRLSAPRPDYALRVVPASINLRAGGTVPVTVYAVRHDGFSGAIKDSVKLTLTAQGAPTKGPTHLSFTGRAAINGADVVRTAVPAEDMMQAFFYRHLVPSKELDVATVGGGRFQGKSYGGSGSGQKKLPDVKVISKLPAKIPAGGTTTLQLNIPGYIATSGRVEMELTDPPDGITIKKFVPGKNGAEIILAADGEKIKAGQKGNLIVAVMAKPKDKSITQKFQVQTLPAIPYEVMPQR
ncbi:MAG: PPC domain-containing protein, partial [Kiritimatiellaeota bacterium]|nr:PPC domain-containing protein [Kiritimatiellota bacterium]